MAMAQGYSREYVNIVLNNVAETDLIDEKLRSILLFAETITKNSYKISEVDIENLRTIGCSDEEIFEVISVASLFNYMDRMADALGVPAEGFQDMVEQMVKG